MRDFNNYLIKHQWHYELELKTEATLNEKSNEEAQWKTKEQKYVVAAAIRKKILI